MWGPLKFRHHPVRIAEAFFEFLVLVHQFDPFLVGVVDALLGLSDLLPKR